MMLKLHYSLHTFMHVAVFQATENFLFIVCASGLTLVNRYCKKEQDKTL